MPKWAITLVGSSTDPCCCDEPEPAECCMYPASGLGDTYTEDDLPDELLLTYDFAEDTLMTRDGAQYTETEFGIYRINHTSDGTDDCGESESKWRLQIKNGAGDWITDNCTECLIVPFFVEDQFSAEYKVVLWGDYEIVVTRVTLCEWTGFIPLPVELEGWGTGTTVLCAGSDFRVSLYFDDILQKWSLAFPGYLAGKWPTESQNQSSPEGTYEGADSIYWLSGFSPACPENPSAGEYSGNIWATVTAGL